MGPGVVCPYAQAPAHPGCAHLLREEEGGGGGEMLHTHMHTCTCTPSNPMTFVILSSLHLLDSVTVRGWNVTCG